MAALKFKPTLFNPLQKKIENLVKQFDTIPDGRKKILKTLASFIEAKIGSNQKTELVFICTHNSRRSHISQIWGQVAAAHYGIQNIRCYSGGTEATAFNSRAVQAMEKVGFKITKSSGSDNPVYRVSFSDDSEDLIAFSKKYDSESNPKKDFAAIMTCSHADENCPVIVGMEKRISLPYDDPKDFDGTPLEAEKYLERVNEIGKEILCAFSMVKH
jgi:arsenate reductase (thioredoxin)